MKKLILGLLLITAINLPAQNVGYKYDNAGNRTERVLNLPSSPLQSEETTAIDDVIAKQAFKIFPNPTKGMFAVEITDFTKDVQIDFLLANMNGKVIDRRRANSGNQTFDLSKYPAGIYLLRISMNGETVTWKIIKE